MDYVYVLKGEAYVEDTEWLIGIFSTYEKVLLGAKEELKEEHWEGAVEVDSNSKHILKTWVLKNEDGDAAFCLLIEKYELNTFRWS